MIWLKRFAYELLRRLGFELHRVRLDRFAVHGLRYEADPSSVGLTPEGEAASEGSIRLVRERGLRDLRVLDMCCGVGVIGLSLFAQYSEEGTVREVDFADINIFNLTSLQRALALNGLEHNIGERIRLHLTDGLGAVPRSRPFDLIVCNPPHFAADESVRDWVTPGRLCSYDAGLRFHSGLYASCHELLRKGGELWLLENREASKPEDFQGLIEANPELRFLESHNENLAPQFYWMISQRI